MIGCVLLTVAGVFVATRLMHGRRFGRRFCGGGGWGPGHGHHHHWGGGGPMGGPMGDHFGPPEGGWDEDGDFGGGRHFLLRGLLGRLDATPAQGETIRQAVGELRDAASKLRGEGRKTRDEVAGAFRKTHFDAVLFGELFARHDTAIEELRKAFVGAGARIHDVLDEKQRARLADLIEAGPRWWRRGWRRPEAFQGW